MSPTPKRLLQDRLPRPLFLVLLFSLFSFLSLGSALLTSPSTHATSSSINVSITGSPVVTVTPNAEGKFASGEFAVGITTTHASGYTFSIKAAEGPNPTRLNGTTTEGFLASITSPIPTDTFKNDSTYNEQWGYKPSVLYNSSTKETTANDNYLPSPSTAGDTLAVTHTAGDSSYPISIGTRVTVATVEDVYSNTFIFTAIVNPTPYTLTYNANTSDSVSNMPANISDGETNGETFEISSTVPTRSGYDFKGWCASQVADGATCPTTTYNPDGDGSNLTYTIDQTSATNNVNLYAVWETISSCSAGYICYDGNGADSGEMPDQAATAGVSIMLQAYNYKRDGYGFLGWSTVTDPVIGTDLIYGPMEDIVTPSSLATKGLTLYAVWLPKSTTYTMQSFSASTACPTLSQVVYDSTTTSFAFSANSFIALEDTRDGNIYTVARLSDGNCWMLENLRLNSENSLDASKAQGYRNDATYGAFTGLADSENSNFSNSTTANSLYYSGAQTGTATNNIGTTGYPGQRFPRYNRNNTDINNPNLAASYNANTTAVKWFGYGNYYTWPAAMANTAFYRNSTSVDSDGHISNDAGTSICPKNWRLPIGDNSTVTYSFGALSVSIGGISDFMGFDTDVLGSTISSRIRHFPNNFILSGLWNSASATGRGSYGDYWTSTASQSNPQYSSAYYAYLDKNAFAPGTADAYKSYGLPIRCVAGF